MADKTTHGRTTIYPQREPGARYYADTTLSASTWTDS